MQFPSVTNGIIISLSILHILLSDELQTIFLYNSKGSIFIFILNGFKVFISILLLSIEKLYIFLLSIIFILHNDFILESSLEEITIIVSPKEIPFIKPSESIVAIFSFNEVYIKLVISPLGIL